MEKKTKSAKVKKSAASAVKKVKPANYPESSKVRFKPYYINDTAFRKGFKAITSDSDVKIAVAIYGNGSGGFNITQVGGLSNADTVALLKDALSVSEAFGRMKPHSR